MMIQRNFYCFVESDRDANYARAIDGANIFVNHLAAVNPHVASLHLEKHRGVATIQITSMGTPFCKR